ncbi:MAG: tyrosine-type recombinase/integrase, partial [Mycobacterium sp.]|nr:tyrosine-type recombinase/integrase [Mycobacterium sp.]
MTVYERVRTWGQRSHVGVPLCPHRLRHTFATHLVRAGVGLVTIRDLLGHRQITSTQIYLHVTAEDLRSAAARHPIGS